MCLNIFEFSSHELNDIVVGLLFGIYEKGTPMQVIKRTPLNMPIKTAALVAFSTFTVFAFASEAPLDVGLRVGTLGAGIEVSKTINEKWSARLSYGSVSRSTSTAANSLDLTASLDMQHLGAIADYHPFGGGMRLSLGLFNNNQAVNFTAKAKAGNFTFNGTTYASASVGSAGGKVDFGNDLAPYLGLGWSSGSNNEGGLAFAMDAGVLMNGAPTAIFTVTCGTGLSTAQCNTLKSDVSSEQDKLANDVKSFTVYPVISLGLNYRF